ncbi:MAG: hypothetical protein Q7T61_19865 [Caulobacter sp.]|nr:hypothetical protein [Caulobacter sp.]
MMSRFWQNWLSAWCLAVAVFGVLLALGAFPATDGLVRWLLGRLGGSGDVEMTQPLRFALAVMGPLSIGWALTLLAVFRAAVLLGERGRPTWRMVTAAVVGWYVLDSGLSVATGHGLNVVPNTLLLATFLLPILRSGVLR